MSVSDPILGKIQDALAKSLPTIRTVGGEVTLLGPNRYTRDTTCYKICLWFLPNSHQTATIQGRERIEYLFIPDIEVILTIIKGILARVPDLSHLFEGAHHGEFVFYLLPKGLNTK